MRQGVLLIAFFTAVGMWGQASGLAEERSRPSHPRETPESQEVIVQIGGRFCEYHRADVEGALRQFENVRLVEFLNHHGTVLVHYRSGSETPQQFAGAVERVLAMGWNCTARVDRGEGKLVTNQQEGRP